MINAPQNIRRGIPIYYDKSTGETRADKYERYDEYVVRQTLLHYGHTPYPYQTWINYLDQLDLSAVHSIVDVGCGVGRSIRHMAQSFPSKSCYGLDYSYQMLKRAMEVSSNNRVIELRDHITGIDKGILKGLALDNLQFGLARAEDLPFDDETVGLIFSNFLIDRLTDPMNFIREAHRTLNAGGQLVLLSPLNFNQSNNWSKYYPSEKLISAILDTGFVLKEKRKNINISEPIDLHGNQIVWKCVLIHLVKSC